jgi:hypothetical protein
VLTNNQVAITEELLGAKLLHWERTSPGARRLAPGGGGWRQSRAAQPIRWPYCH